MPIMPIIASFRLTAGLFTTVLSLATSLSSVLAEEHHDVLQGINPSSFQCDLPPVLDPSKDGLPAARDVFSGEEALLKQVQRHAGIVKIPSISYDDNGEPGDDPRWEVFYTLHSAFAYFYPNV
jgi:Gly-Xaa carboxypeptidase